MRQVRDEATSGGPVKTLTVRKLPLSSIPSDYRRPAFIFIPPLPLGLDAEKSVLVGRATRINEGSWWGWGGGGGIGGGGGTR